MRPVEIHSVLQAAACRAWLVCCVPGCAVQFWLPVTLPGGGRASPPPQGHVCAIHIVHVRNVPGMIVQATLFPHTASAPARLPDAGAC
jgi:hypothetical protein